MLTFFRSVCVLSLSITFGSSEFVIVYEEGDPCYTPDSNLGECRKFRNCPSASQIALSMVTTAFSRCGFADNEEILCCPDRSPVREDVQIGNRGNFWIDDFCLQNSKNLPNHKAVKFSDKEQSHIVTLGYNVSNKIVHQCGGIILTELYVIAAAHCAFGNDLGVPTFVKDKSNSIYPVKTTIVHEFYTKQYKYHDIAVIFLERPMQFSDSVRPACLFGNSKDYVQNETASIMEFSAENAPNGPPKSSKVTIVSIPSCRRTFEEITGEKFVVSEAQICARKDDLRCPVAKTSQRTEPFAGDSAMQAYDEKLNTYAVVGLASYGGFCESPNVKVYTRISEYNDWIENTIRRFYNSTPVKETTN